MKRNTTYSQCYSVYYQFGGFFGATITANTREELAAQRAALIATYRKDKMIEGIRWDEIWETSSLNCGGCRNTRFVKKVTNRHW